MSPETIVAAVLFTAWASTVAGMYQMLRSENESQSPVRIVLRITKRSRLTAERDAKPNSLSSVTSEVERHTREFRGDEREGRPSAEDSLAPLKRRAAKLRKALERAQEAEFEILSENREKTPAEESRLRALRKKTGKLEAELKDLTDRINRASALIFKDALKPSNSKLSTDLYDKVERRIRAKEVAADALYRSKKSGLVGVREEWTVNLELSRRMAILAARASVLTKARKEALRRARAHRSRTGEAHPKFGCRPRCGRYRIPRTPVFSAGFECGTVLQPSLKAFIESSECFG